MDLGVVGYAKIPWGPAAAAAAALGVDPKRVRGGVIDLDLATQMQYWILAG